MHTPELLVSKPLFGYYPSIKALKPSHILSLQEVCQIIQGSGLKTTTQEHRNRIKINPKDKSVKQSLPAITCSGNFAGRKVDTLKQLSGFIQIDIDELQQPLAEVVKKIKVDPYTCLSFISPSGDGLKVLVRIPEDKENHKSYFLALEHYYQTKYNIAIDPAVKDLTRLMYLCYDPKVFLNLRAKVFRDKIEIETKSSPNPQKKTSGRSTTNRKRYSAQEKMTLLTDLLSKIEEYNLNLCEDYYDWFRVGIILSNEFGELGRDFFHQISSKSSKYNFQENDRRFDDWRDNNRREIGLGSLKVMVDESIKVYQAQQKEAKRQKQAAEKLNKPKPYSRWSPEDADIALSLYHQGISTKHIGEELGRSAYSVYKKLERMGAIED